ncbi:hypothetical protein MNEG_6728, partial [Monoraphidium neglectum]
MSYRGGGERRREERTRYGGGDGGERRDYSDRRGTAHQDRRGAHHQASYVGNKRGREDVAPADPKRDLIRLLLRLGEPQ